MLCYSSKLTVDNKQERHTMKLGPKTAALFKQLHDNNEAPDFPAISAESIQFYRDLNINLFKEWAGDFPEGHDRNSFNEHTFKLDDGQLIKTKIFTPPGYNASEDSTVIFFPGNAMVFDLLEAHLPGFTQLALHGRCKVIGVDTPLAPEYSAQEINDMSYDLVKTIYLNAEKLNINPPNIILAGYSGGGNLVANIAAKARTDQDIFIKHLFLISPALDFTFETRTNSPYKAYQDMDSSSNAPEQIKPFIELYYKNDDPASPLISPMFEPNLENMPATTIILPEFDACRGDGEAYALRLKEAQVPVEVVICEGQTHLFFIARGVMGDDPDPAVVMGKMIKSLK